MQRVMPAQSLAPVGAGQRVHGCSEMMAPIIAHPVASLGAYQPVPEAPDGMHVASAPPQCAAHMRTPVGLYHPSVSSPT